ncbi:MAG: site-specific integrase, partial [Patescibacteria group bacterium]
VENRVPVATINRRLSTLRHFGRFLTSYQTLDFNFMEGIENATSVKKPQANAISIINEFRAHLEAEKSSPNTIKNYLSDVRQFLSWLETNQETLNSKS